MTKQDWGVLKSIAIVVSGIVITQLNLGDSPQSLYLCVDLMGFLVSINGGFYLWHYCFWFVE